MLESGKNLCESKNREKSRTENKYSIETKRCGIVMGRNCYGAELLWGGIVMDPKNQEGSISILACLFDRGVTPAARS